MSPWISALIAALAVGYVAWRCGRSASPDRPLRVLLGQEDPQPFDAERHQVVLLQDALVKAGWVHTDHVLDPAHFDKAGRYLWWGM